ncbi:MAG: family 16 glycosylhydrolase [Marinilabiliaceae bacterium]|nr:family 16 glycosylhydrolase [Marinilabiliaceae bacterium]
MATFLGITFGSKFPSTSKYELEQQQLIADKKRFNDYSESNIYKRYTELDVLIHTGDFEKKVDKLKNEKFQDIEAYHKHNNYLQLKKSSDIKTFLKFINSGKEKLLNEYQLSSNYIEFKELEQIINSTDFKKTANQKGFKKTDEYKQLKEYKRQKKSVEVKFIEKTTKSKDYQTYNSVKDSSRLQEFMILDSYINSDEFKKIKTFYEDKNRFIKSDEYKLLHEYEEIKKSADYIWFEKTSKNNPFSEINKWEITFSDDFDKNTISTEKWMKGYYWGKSLINDNYSLSTEKQLFTDNNIEVRDSNVRIITKKEQKNGKVWDPVNGFGIADFNYTSGLLNTGHSFRQQYGKFEIKAKIKTAKQVNHAFWLVGERMVPQITVIKTGSQKSKQFEVGTIINDSKQNSNLYSTISAVKLANNYHIFTLEWTPQKLVWKINGIMVHEQTNGIPNTPMYLNFSTHLFNDINDSSLPAHWEIDWVRCYKEA